MTHHTRLSLPIVENILSGKKTLLITHVAPNRKFTRTVCEGLSELYYPVRIDFSKDIDTTMASSIEEVLTADRYYGMFTDGPKRCWDLQKVYPIGQGEEKNALLVALHGRLRGIVDDNTMFYYVKEEGEGLLYRGLLIGPIDNWTEDVFMPINEAIHDFGTGSFACIGVGLPPFEGFDAFFSGGERPLVVFESEECLIVQFDDGSVTAYPKGRYEFNGANNNGANNNKTVKETP